MTGADHNLAKVGLQGKRVAGADRVFAEVELQGGEASCNEGLQSVQAL